MYRCDRCRKALTRKMEIEYSGFLGEYYCSPDCATDRYFEYLDSEPVEFGHWRASPSAQYSDKGGQNG